MGNLALRDMLENTELRQALSWHLTSNHFPPVPDIMIDPCLEAIRNAEDGEWDKLVSLPEGVGYKGLTVAPTEAIIDQHHLHSFLAIDE
jgi:hypothetical protein